MRWNPAGPDALIDLSKAGPITSSSTGSLDLSGVPDLTGQVVTGRRRYPTTWNRKHPRQDAGARRRTFSPPAECDLVAEFGALSFLVQNGDTVLTRIVPRFPGHTDIEIVYMGAPGSKAGEDRIGESVRDTSQAILEAPLSVLQRPFYGPPGGRCRPDVRLTMPEIRRTLADVAGEVQFLEGPVAARRFDDPRRDRRRRADPGGGGWDQDHRRPDRRRPQRGGDRAGRQMLRRQ